MGDITNRQLAEIITMTAEKIQSNVLKERKIANDIENTVINLQNNIIDLDKRIDAINSARIEPDLSNINKFYEEHTRENVNRINSRLEVPNLSLFIWISGVVLFALSGVFFAYSMKAKQDIITEYRAELAKDKVLITKEENKLFDDMHEWFVKNPKTRQIFVDWREKKGKK